MRYARLFLLLLPVQVSAPAGATAAEEIAFSTSEITLHTEHGDHELIVELARTDSERQRGLMYRTELDADTGMLFDFGTTRPASMWMANTLIPLDMVFISEDGVVSGIHQEAEPESKAIIRSDEPVRYVLEIGGGEAAKYGLKSGDVVTGPAMKFPETEDTQ